MAMGAPQHSSITFPSGYLRLRGDPGPWIQSNYDSLMLVQILELADLKKRSEYSIENMTQFNELTHLYMSGCRCFPDNYFATNTRLRHLSLEYCDKKSLIHSLSNDSLSKLSNLETLHIDLNDVKLPANINFPASIKYLSLHHGDMKSLHDSLAKLPNLKTIELCVFRNLNLFPANLYRAKVRLIDCPIKSLPTGLLHLEILCDCNHYLDCATKVGQLYKLANLQTLSITCNRMKLIPSMAGLCKLENFEFKDCFSLKELPSYLGELVSLRNLDISGTRIKSLPGSIMELCNLQHLILPGCFSLETLPRNLKEVFTIDNTHETYYKGMGYFDSHFQASTETSDGIGTAQGCTQTQGRESCIEIVPVAGVDETVSSEQGSITSSHVVSYYFNMGKYFESTTSSEQGSISQVHKDSQFSGTKDLINENGQYVACSSQNQFSSSRNNDFVTIFNDDLTTEQRLTTMTSEYERLPRKVNADKLLEGCRLKYNCSMQSPPIDLINPEHLDISLCVCEELLSNLNYMSSLRHLDIKDCKQQRHHVKELPVNLNEFASLQTLSIQCSHIESLPSFVGLRYLQKLYLGGDGASRLKEFPANLDKLDELLVVDIHDSKIKCLPWSIMKLQKLRFLFLPLDFRLETLPCRLNESVVITVDCMHIRKTWKELKRETRPSSLHGAGMEVPQNSLILSPSGYLRLEDPGDWIQKNTDSCELVQSLELELADNIERIGDFIGELPNLTCLYISGSTCLNLNHLPNTSMALRHLSLQKCNIELLPDSFGKLSNLESLCLDTNLPANLDLLANLRCLCLQYGREQSLIDSMAKLTNLKALHLFECELKSLPETLNIDELKLSDCYIRSLPTGLGLCRHLEILHSEETCKNLKCDVTSLSLKQFVNVEKLFITCHSIECLPNIEILQHLQDLQLKDCSSLEALPENLGNLVKLCTLDISGTRIKSLPDSITKLHNLQHLILPKCFQQDCSRKYLRKEFNRVFVDDTVELYFNDKSYDDDDDDEASMETSNESNGIKLDSVEENNEAISKELEEGIINMQLSPHRLHDTPILGDFCSNGRENSNPKGQSIPSIQNDIATMETAQGNCENEHEKNHILQNDIKGNKRKEISLETLQLFWSKNMTLEEAAEEIGVSRSTMKRRLKDLEQVWPSSRKEKQHLDAKKRKHNNKAPFGSDCSQQNLVNPGNLAAHQEIVGEWITGSDRHMLPNHASSNSNVVINMNPGTTIETTRENLMDTQGDIVSYQRAEEHLDGANECTLSDTLRQNENSSNFIVKATYKEDTIRFEFSLSNGIDQLKEEVGNRLAIEVSTLKLKYQDEEKEWILMTRISDLEHALNLSRSSNNSNVGSVVRLLVVQKT